LRDFFKIKNKDNKTAFSEAVLLSTFKNARPDAKMLYFKGENKEGF